MKAIFWICLLTAGICINGCQNDDAPFLPIGTPYNGGLLAYVLLPGDIGYDANQVHGLIVATEDLGPYKWLTQEAIDARIKNWSFIIDGGDARLGSGGSNTEALVVKYGSDLSGPPAAAACFNLTLNGYDDWFLPSADEITTLNANPSALGLKTGPNDSYWSSTPEVCGCHTQLRAHHYSYNGTGALSLEYKTTLKWVRPMRYF